MISPQRRPQPQTTGSGGNTNSPEKSCSHLHSHLRPSSSPASSSVSSQPPQHAQLSSQQPRQRRLQPLPDVPATPVSGGGHRKHNHKHQNEESCRNRMVAGASNNVAATSSNGSGGKVTNGGGEVATMCQNGSHHHHHHHHHHQKSGNNCHPQEVDVDETGDEEIDVNACRESTLESALTLACMGGHVDLVRLLLSRGADVEHRDKKGSTPLHTATLQGQLGVIQVLLDHSADIEAQIERTKDTPLSIACSNGKIDIVEELLNRNANKEHRNVSDYTPLSLAASGGFVDIIELLLQHSAEINSRTGSKLGISPLMLAAMNGHTEAVKLLLNRGSDINAQIETNKNTALTLACFQGREEVVRLLVERKTNIEHRAKTGLTPLMEAASGGYVEVGAILINSGADVNAPPVPSSRDTALTIAADKGHAKFVNLLLEHEAHVDVKNKKGSTPLWLACLGGHLEVAQKLIQHGADVNMTDNRRVSCLMTAFRGGHVKIVKLLVRHVSQFPSDNDCVRYIQSLSDKELAKRCGQCMDLIVSAKDAQEAEANKNARILLAELSQERAEEERRAALQAKRRERKREKRRAAKQQEVTERATQSATASTTTTTESTSEAGVLETREAGEGEEYTGDLDEEVEEETTIPSSPVEEENSREATPSDPASRVGSYRSSGSLDHQDEETNHLSGGGLKKRKRKKLVRGGGANGGRSDPGCSTFVTLASSLVQQQQDPSLITDSKQQRTTIVTNPVTTSSTTSSTGRKGCGRGGRKEGEDSDQILGLMPPSSVVESLAKPSVVAQPLLQHLAMSAGGVETRWTTVPKKRHMLVVPSRDIGRVIGQSGCTVKSIREQTGAHIDIEGQRPGQAEERVIHIKGSQDAVSKAILMIESLIHGRTTGKEILAKASPRRTAPTVVPLANVQLPSSAAVPLIPTATNNSARRTPANNRPLPIVKNVSVAVSKGGNTNNNNTATSGSATNWGGIVVGAKEGVNYAKIAAAGVQTKANPIFPSSLTNALGLPATLQKTSLEANFPTLTESINLHRKPNPLLATTPVSGTDTASGSASCSSDTPTPVSSLSLSALPPAPPVLPVSTQPASLEEISTTTSLAEHSILTVNTSMTSSVSSSPPPPSSTPTAIANSSVGLPISTHDLLVPSTSATTSLPSISPSGGPESASSSTKSFPRAPGSERSQQQITVNSYQPRCGNTPAHSPQLTDLSLSQQNSPPHVSSATEPDPTSTKYPGEMHQQVDSHSISPPPALPLPVVQQQPPAQSTSHFSQITSSEQVQQHLPPQLQQQQEWSCSQQATAAQMFPSSHINLQQILMRQLQQQSAVAAAAAAARFETPSELLDLPRVSELNPAANSFQPRPASNMSPPRTMLVDDPQTRAMLRHAVQRSMAAVTTPNGGMPVQGQRFPTSTQQQQQNFHPNRMNTGTMQSPAGYHHFSQQQQTQARSVTESSNYNLPSGISSMSTGHSAEMMSYNPLAAITTGSLNQTGQTSGGGAGGSVPTPIGAERRRGAGGSGVAVSGNTFQGSPSVSLATAQGYHQQSQPQNHVSYQSNSANSNWSGISPWSSPGNSQQQPQQHHHSQQQQTSQQQQFAALAAVMQQQQQLQQQQQYQQYQQQKQQHAFNMSQAHSHQPQQQQHNTSQSAANSNPMFWRQQWPPQNPSSNNTNPTSLDWGLNLDKM